MSIKKVLEGRDVDVIEPFPLSALAQAAQWMRCYKTLIFWDGTPQTNEEIEDMLRTMLSNPANRSWGIIDKNNLSKFTKLDTPLVGMGIFEQTTKWNGYFHVASNRRAWGEKLAKPGLMEQAGKLILAEVFDSQQSLLRVSGMCLAANKPAQAFAQRAGFAKDGYLRSMITQDGKPADIVHYGLLREDA